MAANIVCIVDDDVSVRASVGRLLRAHDFEMRAFSSAESFLASYDPSTMKCIVLDVTMPGMDGAELQDELLARGRVAPVVFITARSEPALRKRLLERGAVACLDKPFDGNELLNAVRTALLRG